MSTDTNLDDINFNCGNCSQCSLSKNRKVPILGQGARNPDIVMVVDRTSVQSSVNGNIFSGREGSVLNYFIRFSKLDPEFLYVTPSVFCPTEKPVPQARPKEIFSAPKLANVKACRKWLHKALRVLDPNMIIAMGPTSVAALRSDETFTQSLGRMVEANIEGHKSDYKLPMMVIDSVVTLLRSAQNPGKIWNKNLAYVRWASAINQQLRRNK